MYSARLTRRGEERLRIMQAEGNQGKALARSRILQKSIFIKIIFIFKSGISPFSYFLNSFYFSKILVENHSPSRGSGTSLHNRGATLIRIQNTQLRIPSHPAYVARRHAYANLSSTNFPNLEPSLRHPRIQYTSQSGTLTQMGLEPQERDSNPIPPESTRYSRHLSTPSARLSARVWFAIALFFGAADSL